MNRAPGNFGRAGVRIAIKQVPLSRDEAFDRWKADVLCALSDLKNAIETPLPETRSEHIRIKPGEPGYEDAQYEECIEFHPCGIDRTAS